MRVHRTPSHHPGHPPDRGAALIVALTMLVVMLTLGIGALRLTSSEERMAGHVLERQRVFQAAEAALREIEARIADEPPKAKATCADVPSRVGTRLRVCPAPAATAVPRWQYQRQDEWDQATPVGEGATRITPFYLVEHLADDIPCDIALIAGRGCRQFRITVRAGGNGRAAVMLQSIFLTD